MKNIKFILLIFVLGLSNIANSYSIIKENKHDNEESPHIINIINFVRQTDYRIEKSDSLMFHTVEEQIKLINKYNLPVTFLLQYDALINPKYQKLLKTKLNRHSEIGGWFEITQPQVEAAGLK